MAGNQGPQPSAPPGQWAAPTTESAALQDSAHLRTQLGQEVGSGTQMQIDPDQVEALANFFEDEAKGLGNRMQDITQLATLSVPGHDPVSTQAVKLYGSVATGDTNSYFENYQKLIQVLNDTVKNLRANAQQTRASDEEARSGLRGGNLA